MIIVIPMAGKSQRFHEAGYTEPKFKLSLAGRSVFSYAVGSFETYFRSISFLFVHRDEEDIDSFIISECRKMGIEKPNLVALSKPTRGQAETVVQGLNAMEIGNTEPITIFNIDTFRPGFNFPDHLNLDQIDGYLEVFRGGGSNWSYVRPAISDDCQVAQTSEKVEISDLCCTGLYYFRDADSFKASFEMQASGKYTGELYVAPLYNNMIKAGAKIFYHEISQDELSFCGIPEEYELLKKRWESGSA